jgi:hypothetical protein
LDLVGVLTFPNVIRLKADHAGRMIGFITEYQDHNQCPGSTVGVLPNTA